MQQIIRSFGTAEPELLSGQHSVFGYIFKIQFYKYLKKEHVSDNVWVTIASWKCNSLLRIYTLTMQQFLYNLLHLTSHSPLAEKDFHPFALLAYCSHPKPKWIHTIKYIIRPNKLTWITKKKISIKSHEKKWNF